MNPADIQNILTAGENLHIEFKEAHNRLPGTHQLAGLANRKLSLFSEQRVVPHLTTADLRPELFDKVRRLMRSGDRRHPWVAFSDEELLKLGGFYNRDPNTGRPGLTMAAVLLFGSDEIIQSIVPGYKFDCLLRRRNQERYDDRLIVRSQGKSTHSRQTKQPPAKIPPYREGEKGVGIMKITGGYDAAN